MRYSLAPLALAALAVASPMPQGVTQEITPNTTAPSGCETSYDGTFNIQIMNVSDSTSKRSLHKRQANVLSMTLSDGVLTDSKGRTGYIAANSQFQFDDPPQTGAIYTAGWSVCSNNRLTLGDDDIFYSCLSGNFYNLYDANTLGADQCTQIYIMAVDGSSGVASVQSDGQPTASAVASQQPDGQVTASAVAPVTQISDGQVQAQTSTAVAPVTQISDGQIQAPTSSAVSPITQISDGQIQAPTGTAVVSQISDGQVQAPTNGSMVYPSVPVQTGNSASGLQVGSGLGLFAAIFGVAML